MSRWIRWIAGITVIAGLGFAIVGCSNSSPTMGDKMGGEKMSGEKMGGEKMGGDKMMKDKPGG